MIRLIGPQDSPRIRIVERKHPSLENFKRYYWQVSRGKCFPGDHPLEEWAQGGWVLYASAEQR